MKTYSERCGPGLNRGLFSTIKGPGVDFLDVLWKKGCCVSEQHSSLAWKTSKEIR